MRKGPEEKVKNLTVKTKEGIYEIEINIRKDKVFHLIPYCYTVKKDEKVVKPPYFFRNYESCKERIIELAKRKALL